MWLTRGVGFTEKSANRNRRLTERSFALERAAPRGELGLMRPH